MPQEFGHVQFTGYRPQGGLGNALLQGASAGLGKAASGFLGDLLHSDPREDLIRQQSAGVKIDNSARLRKMFGDYVASNPHATSESRAQWIRSMAGTLGLDGIDDPSHAFWTDIQQEKDRNHLGDMQSQQLKLDQQQVPSSQPPGALPPYVAAPTGAGSSTDAGGEAVAAGGAELTPSTTGGQQAMAAGATGVEAQPTAPAVPEHSPADVAMAASTLNSMVQANAQPTPNAPNVSVPPPVLQPQQYAALQASALHSLSRIKMMDIASNPTLQADPQHMGVIIGMGAATEKSVNDTAQMVLEAAGSDPDEGGSFNAMRTGLSMAMYQKLQNPALKEAMRRSMDPAKFAEMERNATDDMNAFVASNPSPTKRKVVMGIAEPISKIDPSAFLHYFSQKDALAQNASQFNTTDERIKEEFGLKKRMADHAMSHQDQELAIRKTHSTAQIAQIEATTQNLISSGKIDLGRYMKESSKEAVVMAQQDFAHSMALVTHLDDHLKLSAGLLGQQAATNQHEMAQIDKRQKDMQTSMSYNLWATAIKKNPNKTDKKIWTPDLLDLDTEIGELKTRANALRAQATKQTEEAAKNAGINTPEGRAKYLKDNGLTGGANDSSFSDLFQTNLLKERANLLSDKFRGGDAATVNMIVASDPATVKAMAAPNSFKVVNGVSNSPLSDKDIREITQLSQFYHSRGITPSWEAFPKAKSLGVTMDVRYQGRLREMYDAMITLKGKM